MLRSRLVYLRMQPAAVLTEPFLQWILSLIWPKPIRYEHRSPGQDQQTNTFQIIRKLQAGQPLRVAVLMKRSGEVIPTSFEEVIAQSIKKAHLDVLLAETLPLLHEIWRSIDIFVFDIRNNDYNYDTAHVRQDLSVLFVKESRLRLSMWEATTLERTKVNEGVARHHNLNGFAKHPPFIADHSDTPPQYPNPRDASMLVQHKLVKPQDVSHKLQS